MILAVLPTTTSESGLLTWLTWTVEVIFALHTRSTVCWLIEARNTSCSQVPVLHNAADIFAAAIVWNKAAYGDLGVGRASNVVTCDSRVCHGSQRGGYNLRGAVSEHQQWWGDTV
jgi:hypothetical protein